MTYEFSALYKILPGDEYATRQLELSHPTVKSYRWKYLTLPCFILFSLVKPNYIDIGRSLVMIYFVYLFQSNLEI